GSSTRVSSKRNTTLKLPCIARIAWRSFSNAASPFTIGAPAWAACTMPSETTAAENRFLNIRALCIGVLLRIWLAVRRDFAERIRNAPLHGFAGRIVDEVDMAIEEQYVRAAGHVVEV